MVSGKIISNSDLIRQLQWRYAVKKFDPSRKIPLEDWATLEETLRLAPSSYGLQPWIFVWVRSDQVRRKLTSASWNQKQVEECSHFVVLARLREVSPEYIRAYFGTVARTRGIGEETLEPYREFVIGKLHGDGRGPGLSEWAARQAYIAMGSFMTAAAILGIDACPMEGLEPEAYDEILGLADSPYGSIAALAAGYRSASDETQFLKKVRFTREEVIREL